MKTIELRGIIVPPEFDGPEMAEWIERGIFTPTSKVERELAEAAEKGENVRLVVDSGGGDVLAGNSILNRLSVYPHDLVIECGAIVASEAANIVIQLCESRPVECHANTIFLWHSARSEIEGGADALRDEARFIDLINDPIKQRLIAHGVPTYSVERGFSEGREYLMSAQEAVEYGIVSRILGAPAKAQPQTITQEQADTILGTVSTRFPLAAYATASNIKYNDMAKRKAECTPDTADKPKVKAAEDTEEVVKVEETETKTEETEETEKTEKTEKTEETPADDTERRLADLSANVETLRATIDEMEKTIADLRAENESLKAKCDEGTKALDESRSTVAELRDRLASETKKRLAVVGHVLSGNGCGDAPRDWREACKVCGSPALAFEKYPHLAKAWRETH